MFYVFKIIIIIICYYSTFDHPYPTTKIMWIPDSKGIFPDLLATSGKFLNASKKQIY